MILPTEPLFITFSQLPVTMYIYNIFKSMKVTHGSENRQIQSADPHFRNVVTFVWCKVEEFPEVRIHSGLLGCDNHVVW